MNRHFLSYAALLSAVALAISCGKADLGQNSSTDDSDLATDIENVLVPIELTKAESQVAGSASAFAFDAYRALNKNEQMLFSPLSLSLVLSMASCGADGNTAQEMNRVLGFDGYSAEDIASYYGKMVSSLSTIDRKTTFESANSVWIDRNFAVRKPFLDTVGEHFAAEARNVPLTDPSTLDAINQWCSDNTHGRIEKIFDRIDPECVMILANALYFDGQWTYAFNDDTKEADFTTATGGKVKADMMSMSRELSYSSVDGWSKVDIPYGNMAFMMSVILPPDDIPFSKAAEEFTFDRWNSLLTGHDCKVNLQLPEFKFGYEVSGLKNAQMDLGMKDAFAESADFSGIAEIASGAGFFIGDVVQKTFIDVNTKGTVAAAVTGGGFTTAVIKNADFVADRPFFFLIRETTSNSILFIGQKVD